MRPDVNAYLMLNHGVLCCGAGITQVVQAVEDLESLARAQLTQRIHQQAGQEPSRRDALIRVADLLASPSTPERRPTA